MAFTNKDDINILQPSDSAIVGAGAGNDTYVLALDRLSAGQQVQISDALGNNKLQLIGGLTIASSIVTSNAVQLTLSNGAIVSVLGADSFSYEISGNPLTNTAGALQGYAAFATTTLGAALVPNSGKVSGATNITIPTGISTAPDTTAPTVSSFNPTDGATGVAVDSNITLTFSEAILRGSGIIQLHSDSASGTVVETFDATSSSRLKFSGNMLTIDPTSNLSANTQYFLTFAPGAIKDLAGNSYAGTTTYDFKTATFPASGTFDIVINYTGNLAYKKYFDAAEVFWEKVIVGDLPDAKGIDDLLIDATIENIDGQYGTLGYAGPRELRAGSYLPYTGAMKFDSSDMAYMEGSGTLAAVIAHEMGHVLGFGTLWDLLKLNPVFGQYIGANALAEYRTLSGNINAAYVPLETNGGQGTANSHWSEKEFDRELMTGYSESSMPMPLSRLTIAAMKDLGYQVNFGAAEAFTLLLAGAEDTVRLAGVEEQTMIL